MITNVYDVRTPSAPNLETGEISADSFAEITLTGKKVLALIDSDQFDVIYDAPYRGGDDDVMALVSQCEVMTRAILEADRREPLIAAVQLLDACLLVQTPATELRNMVKALVSKDPSLIDHMPQLRALLGLVLRAIEISYVLNPATLAAISRDVSERKNWDA